MFPESVLTADSMCVGIFQIGRGSRSVILKTPERIGVKERAHAIFCTTFDGCCLPLQHVLTEFEPTGCYYLGSVAQ